MVFINNDIHDVFLNLLKTTLVVDSESAVPVVLLELFSDPLLYVQFISCSLCFQTFVLEIATNHHVNTFTEKEKTTRQKYRHDVNGQKKKNKKKKKKKKKKMMMMMMMMMMMRGGGGGRGRGGGE